MQQCASFSNRLHYIKIHQSWFIFLLLLIWTIENNVLPNIISSENRLPFFLWALFTAGGYFFSVLIHEAAHIATEHILGFPVRRRILFPFGGVVTENTGSPSCDLNLTASLAGPVVSIIVASLWNALFLIGTHAQWTSQALISLHILTSANIILTGLNILPLPPFDSAVLLQYLPIRKNHKQFINNSSLFHNLAAILLAVASIPMFYNGSIPNVIWCLAGAAFLREGVQAGNYSGIALQNLFKEAKVRNYLRRNPITVQSNLPLLCFIPQYIYRFNLGIFPVVRHQQLLGFILSSSIKNIPKEQWHRYIVADLTIPCTETTIISSDTSISTAFDLMRQQSTDRLLAVDYGEISGVITLKDILSFIIHQINPHKELKRISSK